MRKYVLWNTTKRQFVAYPGLKSSFTPDVRKARTFETRKEAEANACGDERVEWWSASFS